MHVLFVDDDHALSESVAMALRQQGHSCQTAEFGEQALAFARESAFDIIVLDIALPDIDGFEVIQLLKWEGIEVPVLLESGLSSRDLAQQGAVLGVDEFIAKPFNIAELIARMETIVARARTETAARSPEPALVEDDDAWPEADESHFDQEPEWPGVERRRHERTAMFGAALIMMGDEPIPCVILDISGGGAALRLTEPDQQCPTLFTLEPLEGAPRHCEVRWRRGDTLGVEFV
jgi:DNA-binding response OmpR family regulator